MKQLKTFFLLAAMVLSLAFLSSCAQAQDEREYKNAAKELNEMLVKLIEIPAPKTRFTDKNGHQGVMVDYKQRNEFVLKSEDEWLSIARNLDGISKKYPNSEWREDALFCLSLFAALHPTGNFDEFKEISMTALKDLVYNHPSWKLKKWTLRTFDESIFKKYNSSLKLLLPENLTFEEQNRAMTKFLLAQRLERDGKLEESLKLMNELTKQYSGTKFAEFVQSSIDMASKQGVK